MSKDHIKHDDISNTQTQYCLDLDLSILGSEPEIY